MRKEVKMSIKSINSAFFKFEINNNGNQINWRRNQIVNPKNWKFLKITALLNILKEITLLRLNINYTRLAKYLFLNVNTNKKLALLKMNIAYQG